jgi:hypothetical protein
MLLLPIIADLVGAVYNAPLCRVALLVATPFVFVFAGQLTPGLKRRVKAAESTSYS